MAVAKKSHVLRWLVVLIVLGGVAVGGVAYVKRSKDPALDFKTAEVAHGEIIQVVTANGALNPVRTVTVGSQISGIITELKVDFNSKVKEGDELAKIDPATYERALARAVADLANAQAGLGLAKFNAKQSKQLYADKLISESEFEQNEVALLQADANVKIRQASVDSAKVDLDRTTIFAPISGMVISRKVDAGQTVAASFNTPELFTIANDLTKMQIETLVSEADIGGVEEGQKVNFTVDAFPGRKFSGRVNQVRFAPVTNQNVVNYTTVVEVDNKDLKLRPGMTANVSILVAHRDDALKVPSAALRFRPPGVSKPEKRDSALASAGGSSKSSDKSASPDHKKNKHKSERTVYVVPGEGATKEPASVNGRASGLEPAQVKTGISDGAYTEVLAGLKEGDAVVLGVAAAEARSQSSFNPFVSRKRY